MAKNLKKVRLEKHDDSIDQKTGKSKNCHRFYEVKLDQLSTGQFRVDACWGRCEGYGKRHGTYGSQTKDVVGDVISALVIYQDWICEQEKTGYVQVHASAAGSV